MKDLFIFIGPEKTGTTSIYSMLPFKIRDLQKERFNLSKHKNLKAEIDRIESQQQSQAFIVEPTYFYSENAMNGCHELSKKYKIHLIHTYRDPLQRSISHYLHHYQKGRINNVREAVIKFPEIIDASCYDYYIGKWKSTCKSFHILDINDKSSTLANKLSELGINGVGKDLHANERLMPRNRYLSKISTTIWDMLIFLRLNLIIPENMKNSVKKIVYSGGNKATFTSDDEIYLRNCLIKAKKSRMQNQKYSNIE